MRLTIHTNLTQQDDKYLIESALEDTGATYKVGFNRKWYAELSGTYDDVMTGINALYDGCLV